MGILYQDPRGIIIRYHYITKKQYLHLCDVHLPISSTIDGLDVNVSRTRGLYIARHLFVYIEQSLAACPGS